MEDMTITMYKDNVEYHKFTCPALLTYNILPLEAITANGVYDYLTIEYRGNCITHHHPDILEEWK